ncbi:hypothetical protein [Ferroplasma sp.]|nr:hypothetical protein [Ferroplasma sp.]
MKMFHTRCAGCRRKVSRGKLQIDGQLKYVCQDCMNGTIPKQGV